MTDPKPTVLVFAALDRSVKTGLGGHCNLIETDGADIARLAPEVAATIRAVACIGRFDNADLDRLPNLELIASFGVGYDGIDARYAAGRGIIVTNTPDVLTEEVADATIGLLINTIRQLPRAEAWLRAGHWARGETYPLSPLTLRGRSVGIFGLGRIGKAIARRVEAFGLPVVYHSRRPAEDVSYRYYSSLVELAGAVDTLISAVPGGSATDRVIGREIFEALGPNGVFVNVGRGSTVDEEALIDALGNGTIAAAGLDVFANEPVVPIRLLELGNATVLPHIAAATLDTRAAVAGLVVDNVLRWFSHGRALTPVPESVAARAR
ncbi:MAG TPA: 2-hydroxyacid dehydrogenase [Pseudorhizobium sp.]|nr:2-hydroxyacid dehydrogenase [Pseudorhizobium sp.]